MSIPIIKNKANENEKSKEKKEKKRKTNTHTTNEPKQKRKRLIKKGILPQSTTTMSVAERKKYISATAVAYGMNKR